jgi:AraC-like DNA-binding protein
MLPGPARIVYQRFLPDRSRAFVWKYSPRYGGRRPCHFHAEPELNLVVRGAAVFRVGDSIARVSQGELIGFPAGQDHVLVETTPDAYLYAIGMAPEYADDVLRSGRNGMVMPLHVRLPEPELLSLARHAADIVEQSGAEQRCAELWERMHWCGQRATTRRAALQCEVKSYAGPMHVLTRRALLEMADNSDIGLDSLASKLRINASEVSRYFHRDIGMTFVRYRRRQRLLRFISLAEGGKGNWLAAAHSAGFGSYSQCHRTFQADLGCSPREFFGAGLRDQMQQLYED